MLARCAMGCHSPARRMQSIAEQLLRQNLVTAEQAERAEDKKPRARRARRKKKDGEDQKRAAASQAIETHTVTGELEGEIRFAFTRRNKKQDHLMVNVPTAARLGSGQYAIVEGPDGQALIVGKEAVPAIQADEPERIRYFTGA